MILETRDPLAAVHLLVTAPLTGVRRGRIQRAHQQADPYPGEPDGKPP
jgi:hypothetical protein